MDSNGSGRIDWNVWLREIREIGFTNTLLNFEPNNVGQIDLERAHPGGLAQLAAARTGVLGADQRLGQRATEVAGKLLPRDAGHLLHKGFLGGVVRFRHDVFSGRGDQTHKIFLR